EYLLPPMILQPFVENAIIHGVAAMEGKGRIEINFKEDDGKLLCIISDNGVGRKFAERHQQKNKQHESKALNITKQRLALMPDQKNNEAKLNIVDMKNGNEAAGTRIELLLPKF
ncbi:MAG: histidine kinase, partial [Bacteroidota bacterium]